MHYRTAKVQIKTQIEKNYRISIPIPNPSSGEGGEKDSQYQHVLDSLIHELQSL